MSQISTEPPSTAQNTEGPGTTGEGRGALVRWFLVLFVVFLVLGAYVLLQRRTERKVLAEQAEQQSGPFVSVVRGTPIRGGSEMVLPGNLKAYVESPIYARTNGYLKKWYRDIGSHVKGGEVLADIDT